MPTIDRRQRANGENLTGGGEHRTRQDCSGRHDILTTARGGAESNARHRLGRRSPDSGEGYLAGIVFGAAGGTATK